MTWVAASLIVVLLLLLIIVLCLLYRATKKLMIVDDLLQTLMHDVNVNTKYFEKLLTTPLFQNSIEIIAAMKNVKIMKERLEEFSARFTEILSIEEQLQTVESEKDQNVLHE